MEQCFKTPSRNFVRIKNNADGNCLYESFIHAYIINDLGELNIGDNVSPGASIRAALIRHVENNRAKFEESRWNEALRRLRNGLNEETDRGVNGVSNANWGQNAEIALLADFYNVCISVYTPNAPSGFQTRQCFYPLKPRFKKTRYPISWEGPGFWDDPLCNRKITFVNRRELHYEAYVLKPVDRLLLAEAQRITRYPRRPGTISPEPKQPLPTRPRPLPRRRVFPSNCRSACQNQELTLADYQVAPAEWLRDHPQQEGLVVAYRVGTGKTLTAANVGETLLEIGRVDHVLVLTKKSLLDAFKEELKNCVVRDPSKYTVYSYQNFAGKKHRALLNAAKAKGPFLLMIDEFQHFKNEEGRDFKASFSARQNAKHTVLFSATPLFDSVKELRTVDMLLHGRNRSRFPTKKDFGANKNNEFVVTNNEGTTEVSEQRLSESFKNEIKRVFKDHIATKFELNDAEKKRYPTRKTIVQLVKMDDNQQKLLNDRDAWNSRNAFGVTERQYFNTLFPKPGAGDRRKRTRAPAVAKVRALVKEITTKKQFPTVIYSAFVEAGVNIVYNRLVKAGVKKNKIRKYTGRTTAAQRTKLVDSYNEGEVDVLIISAAGREGLNLKRTKAFHVLEQEWNRSSIEQATGRAIRRDSHKYATYRDQENKAPVAKERGNVDVYEWIGVNDVGGSGGSDSFENRVRRIALAKQALIEQAKRLFEEVAIPGNYCSKPPPPPEPLPFTNCRRIFYDKKAKLFKRARPVYEANACPQPFCSEVREHRRNRRGGRRGTYAVRKHCRANKFFSQMFQNIR